MNVFVDVILYYKQWKPKHNGVVCKEKSEIKLNFRMNKNIFDP